MPKYWDMGTGMGNFSYEALKASNANRTGAPYLRDTSVSYPGPGVSYLNQQIPVGDPGGWRLLRIRVIDPGLWLIHCHITMHQVMVSGSFIPQLMFIGYDGPPTLRRKL
jgi:L-ascorbate oxidase